MPARPTPRPDRPDPYRVLGLSRGATPEQIRTAYRRLARAVHPDVCKAPDAAARFAALAEAYEQLTDPARSPSGPHSGHAPDPDDDEAVYDAFFRAEAAARAAPRSRRPSGPQRGPDDPPPPAPRRRRPPPPFEPVPGTPHLALDLPVDPHEAARGLTCTVPTPAGPREITIPAGTPDAREFRIPGCVAARPGQPGDLIVRVRYAPGSGAAVTPPPGPPGPKPG